MILWGRNDDEFSRDALRFLTEYGRTPDRVYDVLRRPPDPAQWAHISHGLGGLVDAIDQRHPDFREVFHDLDRLGEKRIAMRLHDHRRLIRVPLLLTDEGAAAGFKERAWRDLLGLGKRN